MLTIFTSERSFNRRKLPPSYDAKCLILCSLVNSAGHRVVAACGEMKVVGDEDERLLFVICRASSLEPLCSNPLCGQNY